uniref:Gasdermin pore forming domain-containing protein n=3 Tax=Canis lupus TaxID=9612 RepID=A0A8C0RV45_CANLF
MSSIFEEITRVVVQEMDTGGDMIAIRSILHVDRFHCCSLVRGRRNFWGHQYHRTDLILEDTLERGEGEELFEKLDSGPQGQLKFQVLDTGDSKGMLTVKLPKEVTIARALHKSHKQKVQMLETHIPQQYLDFLELREGRSSSYCCLYREVLEFAGFQKHEGEGVGLSKRPLGSD